MIWDVITNRNMGAMQKLKTFLSYCLVTIQLLLFVATVHKLFLFLTWTFINNQKGDYDMHKFTQGKGNTGKHNICSLNILNIQLVHFF